LAFDTSTDEVLWWDTLIPKEGCRCLALDEEYGLLYAVSYPRDHFIIYDLEKRERRDVGRIGSINSQAIFTDARHRVWTTNDEGHMIRYDPEVGRLEVSPYRLPHDPIYQTGWHSVLYDAVAEPGKNCVWAVTWIANPRLIRIWPEEGEWGRVDDLGPVTQERDLTLPTSTGIDHAGGVTFAADGQLYYVASRWRDDVHNPMDPTRKEKEGVVWRVDPETMEREEVALLERPDAFAQYVSRGAVDRNGNLFFGHVGRPLPVGIFKMELPEERRRENAHLPIRTWG
jgi:hypothetical protein